MVPLIVAYLFLGVLFGALDVGLVARAGDEGFQRHTGWLLSMLAVGSVVAGIRYGTMASSADQVLVDALGTVAALALASAGAAVAAVVMTVVWTRRRHDGSRRLGDQGVRCGRTGRSRSRHLA